MVITRNAGNIGICSCKVGAFRRCASTCKHCKCAFDSILPIDALAQNRGLPTKSQRKLPKKQGTSKKHQLRPRRNKMICVTSEKKNKHNNVSDQSSNEDDVSFYTPVNDSEDIDGFVTGIGSTFTGKSLHSLRKTHQPNKSSPDKSKKAKNGILDKGIMDISLNIDTLDINLLQDTELSPSPSVANLSNIPKLPDLPQNIITTNSGMQNNIFNEDTLSYNNEKISMLIDYFKLPEHYKKNLPAFKARAFSDQLLENHHSRSKRMVTMIVHCIEKIANVLCPGPSKNAILKLVRKQIKYKVEKLGR